jgi:pimeloyl-ACP methyl ester carboxylesterase
MRLTPWVSNKLRLRIRTPGSYKDVPLIVDGAAADGTTYARKVSGKYSHRILKGIGHNAPQEDPQAFAKAVVEVDGY